MPLTFDDVAKVSPDMALKLLVTRYIRATKSLDGLVYPDADAEILDATGVDSATHVRNFLELTTASRYDPDKACEQSFSRLTKFYLDPVTPNIDGATAYLTAHLCDTIARHSLLK